MVKIADSQEIADVVVVSLEEHPDDRGRFIETYRRSWFPLGREMVQSSRSDKSAGSLVGLHYHLHQADYWYVPFGSARVVLHDLRQGSPTESATMVLGLGEGNQQGVFIPPGVAHGFAALSDMTLTYWVDSYYNPDDELGVAWDDPVLGVDWGIPDPVLSPRDKANPTKANLDPSRTPYWRLRR